MLDGAQGGERQPKQSAEPDLADELSDDIPFD
jgi:hypothetical protein